MIYIRVRWNHDFPDEPVMLYSELNAQRMEIRKVEVYKDGHCGYASAAECGGHAKLGEHLVPALFEIAKRSQFVPEEITPSEFECVWQKRYGGVCLFQYGSR